MNNHVLPFYDGTCAISCMHLRQHNPVEEPKQHKHGLLIFLRILAVYLVEGNLW